MGMQVKRFFTLCLEAVLAPVTYERSPITRSGNCGGDHNQKTLFLQFDHNFEEQFSRYLILYPVYFIKK